MYIKTWGHCSQFFCSIKFQNENTAGSNEAAMISIFVKHKFSSCLKRKRLNYFERYKIDQMKTISGHAALLNSPFDNILLKIQYFTL